MPMLDLEKLNAKKTECATALAAATKSGDEKAIGEALDAYTNFMAETVVAEATSGTDGVINSQVLAGRGVRQLTAAENKYYSEFAKVAKSTDPKMAITNWKEAMPTTIIDAVMEDISKTYKLLSLIDFRNVTGLTKLIYNKTGKPTASWGEITSTISNEITGNLGYFEVEPYKLSAFMAVPNDVLELGPTFIDRFIRAILGEYILASVSEAIVYGTGNKQPIGMIRDISDDVSVTAGVYPKKTAIDVTDLSPTTFGTLLSRLAKDVNNKPRAVDGLVLIVNPADYYTKIMPCTTIRSVNGEYVNNVLPVPCEIIQSAALSSGEAVLGMAKKYILGCGNDVKGRIEFDDSVKFLDDVRVYKVKMFATGRALDDNAFLHLDISDLAPQNQKVHVVNADEFLLPVEDETDPV